jgi:hypothetical protein
MNELPPIGAKLRRNFPGHDHRDTGMYHGQVYTVSGHAGPHLEFEETLRGAAWSGKNGGRWSPKYFELVSLPEPKEGTPWWRET